MAKANPVTDEERARIRELHAEGKGRNAIAKELGRSGRTISEEAGKLGLSFARAAEVRAATEVRQADLAALRTQLALDLTQDAMKLRAQMWERTTVYSFGGKENTYNDHTFDEAPAAEKRALMGTAGMAIDRSLKLSPPESDTEGLAAVDAWLKGMMGGS
ncbi:helix-turn-helix domain-containing protein [Streptomyces griseus]|uniref:helix-turn-helix domain-containing protein n=1 Tax=Streptomyces griseus TaxID=1911 RepID=UPI0004C723FA|nr:helix-turn-helix domain-containing protein [Streptomyces griseus]